MSILLEKIGLRLAQFLSSIDEEEQSVATCSREALVAALQPGDILLIDGTSRLSTAIKYFTQSTWSHAALFIGSPDGEDEPYLIEAHVTGGVQKKPLTQYCKMHVRICRPVGLSSEQLHKVTHFMTDRIGYQYDLKNIIDLARYLIQTPPVPRKHRRKLLALGSGEPTKAICSSLIAQAFQLVDYPILPDIQIDESSSKAEINSQKEILHIRHHSLFTPRDFDVSPYFQIIKPSIQDGFDPEKLTWAGKEKE